MIIPSKHITSPNYLSWGIGGLAMNSALIKHPKATHCWCPSSGFIRGGCSIRDGCLVAGCLVAGWEVVSVQRSKLIAEEFLGPNQVVSMECVDKRSK